MTNLASKSAGIGFAEYFDDGSVSWVANNPDLKKLPWLPVRLLEIQHRHDEKWFGQNWLMCSNMVLLSIPSSKFSDFFTVLVHVIIIAFSVQGCGSAVWKAMLWRMGRYATGMSGNRACRFWRRQRVNFIVMSHDGDRWLNMKRILARKLKVTDLEVGWLCHWMTFEGDYQCI